MKPRLVVGAGILVLLLIGGGVAWAVTAPDKVVYFETERFALTQSQRAELNALLPELQDATTVRIDGYVQRSREEDRGKGPARLSEKRADAVHRYLENRLRQSGPPFPDLEWVVTGRGQPPFDVGLPISRRVEIFID